jgi:hypothetical protein
MNSIPFCDKRVYIANHIIPEITRELNRYPLIPQKYVEITNNKININEKCLVTISMTSEKYILFLTKIKGFEYCLFINQLNKEYFYCKFRFNVELYAGTLFLGEFFKNDNGSWSYYIEDIHYLENKSMQKVPFSERIESIYNVLKSRYTWDEMMNICHLEIKPYFMYNYLEKIRDCKYIDKLYFIPESFNDSIKVIKIENEIEKINSSSNSNVNNVQFLTFKQTSKPDIYMLTNDRGIDHGIAAIKSIEQSKFIRNYFRNNTVYRTQCTFNSIFKKWTPLL